jgi:hypothetical protein
MAGQQQVPGHGGHFSGADPHFKNAPYFDTRIQIQVTTSKANLHHMYNHHP